MLKRSEQEPDDPLFLTFFYFLVAKFSSVTLKGRKQSILEDEPCDYSLS